jgi:hypothetical protein
LLTRAAQLKVLGAWKIGLVLTACHRPSFNEAPIDSFSLDFRQGAAPDEWIKFLAGDQFYTERNFRRLGT